MAKKAVKLYDRPIHDVERITPTLAAGYLGKSASNRTISDVHMKKLVHAMERGQWTLGQPIMFNKDGELIDGQHRLHAVIRSGISLDFNVLRNIDAANHIDMGRTRRISDILTMNGYKDATVLSAVTRLVLAMETYPNAVPVPHGRQSASITVDDVLQRVGYDSMMRDVAKDVSGTFKPLARALSSAAVAGWLLYVLRQAVEDQEEVETFLRQCIGEASFEKGSPAGAFYRKMTTIGHAYNRRRISKKERIALLIKAWNAYFSNNEMKQLTWRTFGPRAESFPKLMVDHEILACGITGDE